VRPQRLFSTELRPRSVAMMGSLSSPAHSARWPRSRPRCSRGFRAP